MDHLKVWLSLSISLLAPLYSAAVEQGSQQLTSAGVNLTVVDQTITVKRGDDTLLQVDRLQFDYTDATAWTLVEKTEDQLVYELTFPAVVNYNHEPDDNAEYSARLEITVIPGGFRIFSSPEWAKHTSLGFPYLGDQFFGLAEPLYPDNRKSPSLNGATIPVDVEGQDFNIVENFASAFSAFYMSSHRYGAFFDTFARGEYSFEINGRNSIYHSTGTLDWRLFFGEDGAEIHEAYFNVIGAPKKLPLWGLGAVVWRDHNTGSAQVLEDIAGFHRLRIPLTAVWIDRPYSEGAQQWSRMNFAPAFSDPDEWIAELEENYGVKLLTWASTATFGDERFPKHHQGSYTYVDLSDEASYRAYQETLIEQQYAVGVKGHKIDRSDEFFPIYESWADKTPLWERRNRYVYLTAKVHHEALTEIWGQDHLNFMRAAIHRAQPYISAVWGGDPRTNWEGLQSNIANGMRCSFMGFPVFGTDVGGYLGIGRIPEDLYLRWLQAGSMNGFFEIKLDGARGDRLPWRYDESFQDLYRAVIEDRMSLLPYFYSLANRSAKLGAVMQPMAYRHLEDPETHDIWDQFYVGDILVAPVLTKDTSRRVYFPEGRWHDYDNLAHTLEGGRWATVEAPLEKLPRYVRANSLWVTGNLPVGSAATWRSGPSSLTIHAIPGNPGESRRFVYVDALRDDAEKEIVMEKNGAAISLRAPAMEVATTVKLWVPQAPVKMEPHWNYEPASQILSAHFGADQKISLTVKF